MATDPIPTTDPQTSKTGAPMSANRFLQGILLMASGAAGGWVLAHEPTTTPRCERVRILGVQQGSRGTEYFLVQSLVDPKRRLVGRFNEPFSQDYTGPAALWITEGRLTGWKHYKMSAQCSEGPPSS